MREFSLELNISNTRRVI